MRAVPAKIAYVGLVEIAKMLSLYLSPRNNPRLTFCQVTVGIPAGGTGEIIFEKAGVRRSEAARAVNGTAIPRGSEVVITAYAKGFATVQPWGEFIQEHDRLPSGQKREA